MDINIGITADHRKAIAAGLSKMLATTYSLYMKTHNFHWNVTGPHFQSLHAMFETQYTELALAVDNIAERIRALGEFAPGGYSRFAELSIIPEENGVPKWQDMVTQLVQGHEALAKLSREIQELGEQGNDNSTVSLLDERTVTHEKTAWMLRSLLA